ncbi:MAG: hypothetical protein JWM05_76 [Acidimicrobiales bacterium]|nr:hypothetical protein [Acidimicrobiales bacterium]
MSDVSQGPGWWQAADGRWYSPDQMPASVAPTQAWATDPSGQPAPVDGKSFVKSLYDFEFDHFVTPKVIRFFYGFFVVVLSVAAALLFLASLASGRAAVVVIALFVIPVGYFMYLVAMRMYFELVAALFRIADDLRAIRRGRGD